MAVDEGVATLQDIVEVVGGGGLVGGGVHEWDPSLAIAGARRGKRDRQMSPGDGLLVTSMFHRL
ncbi:hypothetical protein GCM10027020_11810 [Nocardioides salsibiostraticola]